MKGSDRMIVLVLPLLALVGAFWFLVIAPKRQAISDLDEQAATLGTTISTSEAQIQAAQGARRSYASNYADIVSLGAAAPEDGDQATFVYDLGKLGEQNAVQMRSFELAEGPDAGAAPAAAPAPATPVPADGAATVAAQPTEAAAAALPIGASVGPAGLPVMPYKVRYSGTFFNMADLFAGLDSSVQVSRSGDLTKRPEVRGRLVTVDGFALVGDPIHGFPQVQASIALTTYNVPAAQGLVGGASPAGPPAASSDSGATLASGTAAAPSAAVTP